MPMKNPLAQLDCQYTIEILVPFPLFKFEDTFDEPYLSYQKGIYPMNRITDPSLRKTISLFYLTKSFWKTFSMYLKQSRPS